MALFVLVNLLNMSSLVFYFGQTIYSILLLPDDFTREWRPPFATNNEYSAILLWLTQDDFTPQGKTSSSETAQFIYFKNTVKQIYLNFRFGLKI